MEIAESVPTGRVRATSDKIFQATSDKILIFYNFMRALLRQTTILSLVAHVVAPCAFTPLGTAANAITATKKNV